MRLCLDLPDDEYHNSDAIIAHLFQIIGWLFALGFGSRFIRFRLALISRYEILEARMLIWPNENRRYLGICFMFTYGDLFDRVLHT